MTLLSFPCTDAGNAERLIALHGTELRRCGTWSSWLAWCSTHWRVDEDAVFRFAKTTARALAREAGNEIADDDRRKAVITFALRSESRRGIDAMVALAQHEEAVAISAEQLDADPMLLNVSNGTIDLRTGDLRPHRREDLITKIVPVEFDPAATCPTWSAFLDRVLASNANVIEFLQRAMGYSLTGRVDEQVLFFLLGLGANGKSTFLGLPLDLLGGYARQAAPELLLAKTNETHPTEQADLFGCRFAVCTEIEAGRALAEVTVKQLTGGDRIKARRMREDFWSFAPTHKIWIAANHKPTVKGTDHAIWRRIRLIPFDVTIPPSERDPKLPEKLRAELPGILAWAVRGCLAWQRDGLAAPAEVRAATEAYREEQDVIGGFLADCCELAAGARVASGVLRATYETWCGASGEQPLKPKTFGLRLKERGLSAEKGPGGVRMWSGIRVAETASGASGRHFPGSQPCTARGAVIRDQAPPRATRHSDGGVQ